MDRSKKQIEVNILDDSHMNIFRLNILFAIQEYQSRNSRRCQSKGLDAAPPGIVIPFKLYKKQDTLSKQNRNYPIPIKNGNWLGLTDPLA